MNNTIKLEALSDRLRDMNWQAYGADKQNSILDALFRREIVHGVKLQTSSYFSMVCKGWRQRVLDLADRYERDLAYFHPLFTPMLKRFCTVICEIDTSPAPKYGRDDEHRLDICLQNKYEDHIIFEAILAGSRGYSSEIISLAKWTISSINLSATERVSLVTAAEILISNYYNLPLIAKIFNIATYNPLKGKFFQESSRYATMTIGELLEEINNIKNNSQVSSAWDTLRLLILKAKLLPIDQKNLALSTAKVGQYDRNAHIKRYSAGWCILLGIYLSSKQDELVLMGLGTIMFSIGIAFWLSRAFDMKIADWLEGKMEVFAVFFNIDFRYVSMGGDNKIKASTATKKSCYQRQVN